MIVVALALIPLNASAHGAVIVVIDALGSSYLSPHTATYTDGTPIPSVDLKAAARADASCQLQVPVPATEYGHAVIVTGYSGASQETVGYYHSTIFDALKDDGYIALGILENGDSSEMLGKLDAVVREKNDSIYTPDFEFIQHGDRVPPDVVQMMKDYPLLPSSKAGKDKYAPYIKYNDWSLDFTGALVTYMNKNWPGVDYILIVNAGGLDHSGHNSGAEGYETVLSALDDDMESLIDICKASGAILMVTGDHGMSFAEGSLKGAHASSAVSSRNESLLTPLLVYSDKAVKGAGGTYGQECLAPTLLSLLDEPNTMSLSDGEPLPVKEKPTLFLKAESPANVTVTGLSYAKTVSFSGIYSFTGLDKGDYTVTDGGGEKSVHLAHDELIDISEDVNRNSQGSPAVPTWAAYVAAAAVSVVGVCAALTIARSRK